MSVIVLTPTNYWKGQRNTIMNILFMEAGESGRGGSFVSLLQLLTLLAQQGHKLSVILWNPSPFIAHYEALGARVFCIDNPIYTVANRKYKFIYDKLIASALRSFPQMSIWIELLLQYRCYRQVMKIAGNNDIDLLHLNNQPIRNFIGFWVAKRIQLPVIAHIRTLNSYGFSRSHINFIEKLNCKLVAVSNAAKQCWLETGIPAQWVQVLHNPYDGVVKRRIEKTHNFCKKIVYIGRLEVGKGLDFLLESFTLALQANSNLSLTVIGSGSEYDRLLQLGKHYNLDKNLNFLGYIKNAKERLPEFDVLVLPSQQEGFGRVILEAMAHGVGVIATQVGGVVDIVKNEINGLLVNYGDPQALADAILQITNDAVLCQNMIAQAYETVTQYFNQDTFYTELMTGYQSLTCNQRYDMAIVISDLGSGGTQRVVSQLISYWSRHGKFIAVITFAARETDFFVLPQSVDRYVIGGVRDSKNRLIGLLANIKRIKKLRKKFITIRTKKILSFLCATNILTILAAYKLNSKIIISERNDPARQSFGIMWDWLRQKLYRHADMVTANTRQAIETMSRYVPENKLQWVQNPIAELVVDNAISFNQPTILAVGRLHHQKGYDILLQAFSKFCQEYPAWRLAIIGDGLLKEQLMKQAKLLGIARYITWYGRVSNPFPYYCAAKIFVMPSRHEGMPNALLEAMSCGLPVIISDALPGPLEYVENNVSGLVVPVENATALANGLSQLANDEKLRQQLAAAAKTRLSSHSIQEVIGAWNAMLS